MARTDLSSRKKKKRQKDSQPIRCTVQNAGNQVLTKLVEYGHKIEERVKAMQSEIKKNIQGTNCEGNVDGIQINDLEQKEELNIQPE